MSDSVNNQNWLTHYPIGDVRKILEYILISLLDFFKKILDLPNILYDSTYKLDLLFLLTILSITCHSREQRFFLYFAHKYHFYPEKVLAYTVYFIKIFFEGIERCGIRNEPRGPPKIEK